MEKRRVVITGLGTVNPLGNTAADSWAAAKAGRCGIGPITQFDTTDFKCKLAGEVKNFDPETVVDKKEARKMARFTLLALAAAAEAIADSGLNTEAEAKNIGVVLSSGIGGLPTIEEQHTRGEEKGMEKVSPYFVPMSIANMAAAQVAIRFGLKGMCTCPVTACAGGTNAVGDAFHRIRDGYEPVMVCGGAESCISPLGIGGFTTTELLEAMDECSLELQPAHLFLNIGTNDLNGPDYDRAAMLGRYEEIVQQIRKKLPETKLYLLAYYPVNPTVAEDPGLIKCFHWRTNERIREASEGVQALARKYGAEFLDLNKDLYDAAGNLKAEYTIEGMHLYANGYRPVMDALLPLLRKIGEEQGGKQ